MPYVGNPLADAFSSREKQDLTGQSGTSFTLTHAVSHANDLSVYINHVRQEPTTAYTVNGTTLTTTGSVAGTDDFYIIYDELAVQSISHPTDQALTATSGTFTSGLVGTTATFSGAVSGTTGTFSSDLTVDSGTLKVDSSNNKVGIGTTSPASQLHIDEGNSNSYATLRLEGNNRGGDIEMYQGTVPVSTIRTDQSGNMYIKTSGAYGSSSLSNKIVLLTGGNVGIGTDSPASPLGANYRALDINSGVWGGTVNFSGNSGGYIGNRHSGNGGLGYYAASGQGHHFATNGSTTAAATINSDGRVGIGAAGESTVKLEVNAGALATTISGRSDGGNGNNRRFNINAISSGGTYGGGLVLETRDTSNVFRETLRANHNRQLILGGSTADANGRITIKQAVSNGLGGMFIDTYAYYANIPGINITNGDTNNARNMEDVEFHRNGGLKGYIRITSSGTAFTSNSDYRLKEDEKEITNAIEQIKKLKPYNFKWKNSDDRQDGFFAHEVDEVFDYVAQGEKDATQVKKNVVRNKDGFIIAQNVKKEDWEKRKDDADNDESSPKGETTYPSDSTWQEEYEDIKAQTVDNSKLVPILTAALQEAIKRIEALESK